ncbi:MAG: hypothetical protein CR988_02340 [Treponema sp.]|nr:MAG: hypothetical protein CR988_02340 [Treponema sp.]
MRIANNPNLVFPKVPDTKTENGKPIVILLEDDKTVQMPLHYWQSLVRYILKIEKIRKEYDAWVEVWSDKQ